MKIKMSIFLIVLSTLFWVGCEEDGYPIFYPGSSHPEDVQDPDRPDPDPPVSLTEPDYSRLTAENHPRIIFTDKDFAAISEKVASGADETFSSIHSRIISSANSYCGAEDIRYELAGKRLLSVSRNAEQRILFCAYAYKTTGDVKYLEQAEHDIRTVCGFQDWNARRHFLDVGEMAAGVGLGYDWLYDELSPETKELARQALNDFAFTPANEGTWNLNFYEAESNWNQVCNGGLVCAALAVYENNSSVAQGIIEKALESNLPVMQALYAPDGNYPEGYSYWCYGTIYEALMLTALETAAGTDTGLSNTEGFSETGRYMLYMEGTTRACFNYSDCAPSSVPCLAQWYFAWKFNDLSLLYLEQDRIGSYAGCAEARLLPLVAYYASNITLSAISAPTESIFRGEGTTPVVLIHDNWAMDDTDKFLGIKGGKANTSHSHMDAGSFVYDAFGVRWSADMGLQSYGTLEPYINLWDMNDGSERWTAFRYNNFNHSTLTVNESYHRVAGEGVITGVIDSNGQKGATVDITEPLSNDVSSAVRTIYIEGDDLIVEDRITARTDKDADVRWTMVTRAVPEIGFNRIQLSSATGKNLYLSATSPTGDRVAYRTWSTVSPNSWDASNTGYYECGYELTVKAGDSATIRVRLSPDDPAL